MAKKTYRDLLENIYELNTDERKPFLEDFFVYDNFEDYYCEDGLSEEEFAAVELLFKSSEELDERIYDALNIDSNCREAYLLAENILDEVMELKIKSQIGTMDEEIMISKEGKDLLIGFNPKFLIDALRVIDDEEVTLYLMNPKAPCFIKDDKEMYVYLILPVNFNAGV